MDESLDLTLKPFKASTEKDLLVGGGIKRPGEGLIHLCKKTQAPHYYRIHLKSFFYGRWERVLSPASCSAEMGCPRTVVQ